MGANRTKKTQQTPCAQPAWFACCDRPCLGSLCSVLMAALQIVRSNAAPGQLRRVQDVSLYCSQKPVSCYSAQAPSKTLHYTIRSGLKSATLEFVHGSWGPAQTPTLLTVLHAALCSAGRCAILRAVQRCALCNDVRSVALGAV